MTIEQTKLEQARKIALDVYRETGERLRSIAEREKTSIGKVIDAWAKSQR